MINLTHSSELTLKTIMLACKLEDTLDFSHEVVSTGIHSRCTTLSRTGVEMEQQFIGRSILSCSALYMVLLSQSCCSSFRPCQLFSCNVVKEFCCVDFFALVSSVVNLMNRDYEC